ncbi:MAG: hypothetical protein ACYST6_00545 [Planctomycetota bacterium]
MSVVLKVTGGAGRHAPAILRTARTASRQARSNAALITLMSWVFGCVSRHANAQTPAISDMRKTNDMRSLNISIL